MNGPLKNYPNLAQTKSVSRNLGCRVSRSLFCFFITTQQFFVSESDFRISASLRFTVHHSCTVFQNQNFQISIMQQNFISQQTRKVFFYCLYATRTLLQSFDTHLLSGRTDFLDSCISISRALGRRDGRLFVSESDALSLSIVATFTLILFTPNSFSA